MNKQISVIIPVYNVAECLENCINSILAQSYNNLEILIIDDGSNDGSEKICDLYINKDPRITVYHKENGGLSDARNYGIERAHGSFLAFIDSDDAIHRDFFLELMNEQEKSHADIVSGEMVYFYNIDDLHKLLNIEHHNKKIQSFTRDEAIKEYFAPKGKRLIHHGLCMKIYKSELFKDLRFEIGKLHEDLYITYKLINIAEKYVCVDIPYYFYFQRDDSICHRYTSKNFFDEIEAYNRIYQCFRHDQKIENELNFFISEEYFDILKNSREINRDPEIQQEKQKMKRIIRQQIRENKCYSAKKTVIRYLALKNIKMFAFAKDKLDKHRRKQEAMLILSGSN